MDNRISNISFGANFVPHVTLNKARWHSIGKEFEQITENFPGHFHLVQSTLPSNKRVYFLSTKTVGGVVRAEDSKYIPSDILGKWLMDLDDKAVAEKLAKVFAVLKIRKQAIYDLRKMHKPDPIVQENLADRYISRIKRVYSNDEDIILPKHKVDTQKHAVWDGVFDAKSELYRLNQVDQGQKVVANVN